MNTDNLTWLRPNDVPDKRVRTRIRVRYDRIVLLVLILAAAFLAGAGTMHVLQAVQAPACSWHAPMLPVEGCSYIPFKDLP